MAVVAIYKFLQTKISPIAGAGVALAIGLVAPVLMGSQGWDDHNRSGRSTTIDFATNYLESCEPNAILFTQGDNDTYPLWYAQEVENVRTDVRVVNLSLLGIDWYVNHLRYKINEADPVKLTFTPDDLLDSKRNQVQYINLDGDGVNKKDFYDLKSIMSFIARDNPQLEKRFGMGYYLPTKKVSVPVNLNNPVIKSAIGADRVDDAVDNIRFKIKRNSLLKNDLIALDIVANNMSERPIYFAVTVSPGSFLGLQDYFQQEGLVYRVSPLPNPTGKPQESPIHLDKMYALMMDTWQYGGIKENPNVLMDENTHRMVLNAVSNFTKAAEAHIAENRPEKAVNLLDKCLEELPFNRIGYSHYHGSFPGIYYRAGAPDKAKKVADALQEHFTEELAYMERAFKYEYKRASSAKRNQMEKGAFIASSLDAQLALYALSTLEQGIRNFDPERSEKLKTMLNDYQTNRLVNP